MDFEEITEKKIIDYLNKWYNYKDEPIDITVDGYTFKNCKIVQDSNNPYSMTVEYEDFEEIK